MSAPLPTTDLGHDSPVERLFAEHLAFVWRSLRHLGVGDAALDDAVQDVFVVAHRRWSTFEGRSSERSWLYGIARRVAFRHRRRARRHGEHLVDDGHHREAAQRPFDRLHAAQSLESLLGTIDRDKRTVFVLSQVEGLTAPEIAAALSIPEGTVYSRLRAAWQQLDRAAGRDRARVEGALPRLRAAPTSDERRRLGGSW